jgi:hypothetical protein
MAVETKNYKARFATEGFRVRRLNPDKTVSTAQRTLGFSGLIDISAGLTADKGDIAIKLDAGDWEELEVDFTGETITSITPTAAAGVLNTAGFTGGVTFGVEATTGRLMVSAAGANILQIKGKLAGVLDFGQGRKYGGFGCYFKSYFDDETISITLPNDMKEKEEIDMEGAKGTLERMVIPAMRLGASPAISMKFKDDELTQMIQGGDYIPLTSAAPGMYTPPNSQAGGSPLFAVEVFAPLYGVGTSTMDQYIAFERRIFWSCTGTEGDAPEEAKAWANFSFNLSATEYIDENGVLHSSDERNEYSLEQFEALRIYDI